MSIQVLPKHISDLIAAGEVVERPASVVKELCENAMDAGASAVTVEIRSGGVRYIRVTDNGKGIPRAELPTAFLPHATSKITSADDLDSILTLGFRGEALSSIAAVSQVQILTKTADEPTGCSYEISGGEPGELIDAGCPNGTTIIVRDLFFHTPARMKFLKKDVTEGNYVGAAMERLALSRPDVAVTFLREDKTIFQTPGDGTPAGAVRAVLGKAFYEQLLGVKSSHQGVEVTGFVSRPSAARPNRNGQYMFLNNRWIRCPAASAALSEAYKHSLPSGKFPACVLYITLPAGLVDVNVHPAKTEVRFADDRPVFSAVYQAANAAINNQPAVIREYTAPAAPSEIPQKRDDFWQQRTSPGVIKTTETAEISRSFSPGPEMLSDPTGQANPLPPVRDIPTLTRRTEPYVPTPIAEDIPPIVPEQETPSPAPAHNPLTPDIPNVRVIGEVFQTYYLAQTGEELLLIDKHAAHERILFEKFRAAHAETARQVLLEPLPLRLSREEAAALWEHRELLEQAGFVIDEFGADALVMRECPMILVGTDLCAQAAEMAGYLLERRSDLTTHALEWIFTSAACRAAVKAGDPSNALERERFVENLLQMPDVRTCPHGRPVMISLTKKELEKRFGR